MNRGEAIAVQTLLTWVVALQVWDVDLDRSDITDAELVRVIGVLADRSHTTLGAGLTQGDAIVAAIRMLGMEPAALRATDPDVRDVQLPPDGEGPRSWGEELRATDVPPNAGSAS